MIDLEIKALEFSGWEISQKDPLILTGEDGVVSGKSICDMVIKDSMHNYSIYIKEKSLEDEQLKKSESTKGLDLNNINGNEIIEFLDKEIRDNDDLCDCRVEGVAFESQVVKEGKYYLCFTGDFDNWGQTQPQEGQKIIIDDSGVKVRLSEPFEGDGSDIILEDLLSEWIKNHTFKNDSEEVFNEILKDSLENLSGIIFGDKDELKEVISDLKKAYTYMK